MTLHLNDIDVVNNWNYQNYWPQTVGKLEINQNESCGVWRMNWF